MQKRYKQKSIAIISIKAYQMLMNIISYPQIAEMARKKQLSINKLAQEAGIARSVLDRWRRGETAPTLRTIAKLQRVLVIKASPERKAS